MATAFAQHSSAPIASMLVEQSPAADEQRMLPPSWMFAPDFRIEADDHALTRMGAPMLVANRLVYVANENLEF